MAERRPPDTSFPVPPAVLAAVAVAVLRRPRLWAVAGSVAWSLRAPQWWRRRPFLPVPPAPYARFRFQTMYGGDGRAQGHDPARVADDLVGWLAWVQRERSATPD
jgi:hypothetical protein